MVEDYLLAKKMATDKCGEDCDFYPFMVCSLYALLRKYQGYSELIDDLYMGSTIIFEEGSMHDILDRHHFTLDVLDRAEDGEDSTTFGVSNSGHIMEMDDQGNAHMRKEKPFVVCTLDHSSFSHFLNTFCHEMGHLIKGELNGYDLRRENGLQFYIVRTGLAHYVYCYDDHGQNMHLICWCENMDESVNCIQTTEALQHIFELPEFCEDPRILDFVQKLDRDYIKGDFGYQSTVELVRRLWEIDDFKNLVEANIISGNIDLIVNTLNAKLGDEWFENMSMYLDQVSDANLDPELAKSASKNFLAEVERYKAIEKAKEKMIEN